MKVDLGLTKFFITIYETQNLTQAAELLSLSQPSISYNLNRLRKQLNDELFIRNRHGVSATKIADQLYPQLKKSITAIENAYAETQNFDPTKVKKTFRIGLSDIGEICLLPKLMSYFLKNAPNIKIVIEEVSTGNVEKLLKEDKIEVAIFNSSYLNLNNDIKKYDLFSLRYVCITQKNHPRIKDTLTIEQYVQEKHVTIKSSTGHLQVKKILESMNLQPNIALEVPHFSVLQDLIISTDLLVTLPIDAAQSYLNHPNIKMFELPFHVNSFWVSMHWFDQPDDVKARNWLISTIKEVLTK